MTEGVDGLTRDKTRKPGRQPPSIDTVQREVALGPRREKKSTGGGGNIKSAFGATVSSRPTSSRRNRIRMFKLPTDPKFAGKLKGRRPLRRSYGPCGRPLGRREEPNPGVRPHPAGVADEAAPCRNDAHDYKRHGTTTLFAARNVLEGPVICRNLQRHRRQEFIRFLTTIEYPEK